MNLHKHARLTPRGRALLVRRIQHGLRVEEAAQAAGVSVRTAYKWLRRFREEGEAGLMDRSSRPQRCPHATPDTVVERLIEHRRSRKTYRQIAGEVGVAVSTVARRLLHAGDRLRYLYDFGDNWQHVIAVEAIEPAEVEGTWCEVLDGARASPPEDVGGVPGYLGFLQSISQNPLDEDALAALEWVGGSFDAELFDRRAANAAVQRICNNLWG